MQVTGRIDIRNDLTPLVRQHFAAEYPNEIEAMTKAGDMSVKYGEYHGS